MMLQYAREIAFLLQGCGRALLWAFLLCGLSAVLDLVCMVLLPLFLFATLAGPDTITSGFLPIKAIGWLTGSYETLVTAVIIAFLMRGAVSLYVGGRLTRLSETIRATLTGRIAHHYLTCPFQEFMARSVAWALTMVGDYTGAFAGSVALPLLRLLLDFLTMAAILGFLLFVDHRVVGMTAVVLAGVAVAYYFAVRRISERQSRRLSDLQASFSQHMSRSLHSPREVRLFQLQAHFIGGMQEVLNKSADAQARLTVIGSIPRVLGEFVLIGLALGYLYYRTRTGIDTALMMSQMGLLAFAGLRMLPAFAQALSNISALRAGRHVTGLLAKELNIARSGSQPALLHGEPQGASRTEPLESLELRDISFAYSETSRPILQRVSLRIYRGESIGVVGPSGAGKSTLGDLLLGLIEPTGGDILVNGCPARLGREEWWQIAGFVPQAVFLSNDTLLRNIAFGVPDAAIDRRKAERVASMAQLDDVIRTLPQGLDTLIGDYGARLSGGQRQRVAIARALYRERQFLVLDEATSALDSETEQAIVRAVSSLRGSVTTFIIAHRRSTLDGCDLLVEIRKGQLFVLERRKREDLPDSARSMVSERCIPNV